MSRFTEEVRDAVAKAIADAAGHGMREKCSAMADAALEVALGSQGEVIDVEAALNAGDPKWQAQCRPNLHGSERLFFAVRDIAEMRAMLAGEKKPLPGSGLAVVRVNLSAPAVVPYQVAHRLLGDAYQAGTEGVGFCDQAEELFVAMTSQGSRDSMAVVYAAPPAQGVDLGQFRPAVEAYLSQCKHTASQGYDRLGPKGTTANAKATEDAQRLMRLIDQHDGEG